jgi:cell division protein FtsB
MISEKDDLIRRQNSEIEQLEARNQELEQQAKEKKTDGPYA